MTSETPRTDAELREIAQEGIDIHGPEMPERIICEAYLAAIARAEAADTKIAKLCEALLAAADERDILRAELNRLTTLRPISDYHEDYSAALFWKVPVDEPPVSGWIDDTADYHTHWTPIPTPKEPTP